MINMGRLRNMEKVWQIAKEYENTNNKPIPLWGLVEQAEAWTGVTTKTAKEYVQQLLKGVMIYGNKRKIYRFGEGVLVWQEEKQS